MKKRNPTDFDLLNAQLGALIQGENNLVANLANAAALVFHAMDDINWAGFYLENNGELVLGPFQGNAACVRIPWGAGVCGTAAARAETLVVRDVHEFPGHIACDAASNSEIVVPIFHRKQVIAVLDIDSPEFARFDESDRRGLEKFTETLGRHLDETLD